VCKIVISAAGRVRKMEKFHGAERLRAGNERPGMVVALKGLSFSASRSSREAQRAQELREARKGQ
jgi:hypothetical protein